MSLVNELGHCSGKTTQPLQHGAVGVVGNGWLLALYKSLVV